VRSLTEATPRLDPSLVMYPPTANPSLYFHRELSWLAFNERVLNEAEAGWPLLERLKFLAIFFSNLDEFFMIRVSALHHQVAAGKLKKSPDGLSSREQLLMIGTVVRAQTHRAAELLANDLLPKMANNKLRIQVWADLDPETREVARRYFRHTIFPILTPLVVDPVHPFPFLSNLSLSLAVQLRDPETHVVRFARVKVPEILPRFVRLEGLSESLEGGPVNATSDMSFIPLEEVIRANLADLPRNGDPRLSSVPCHARHGY
jgi:polyphosphate kinase